MRSQEKSVVVDSLIDVSGCRLFFSAIKGSETTILLEVGGGADSTGWGIFPNLLAQETRGTVVTYD